MHTNLISALASIVPIFSLIFIGIIVKKAGLVNRDFVRMSSRLVFKVVLPVMVFRKMTELRVIPGELLPGIVVLSLVTLLTALISWLLFSRVPAPQRASAVQGSFRSNFAILGLAIIERTMGSAAVAQAAVVLAVIMPLYNIVSVVVLSTSKKEPGAQLYVSILKSIFSNPILWGIVLGLAVGLLQLHLPEVATVTLDYVAQLTLPLALLGIGASLSFTGMIKRKLLWISSAGIKLVLLPLLVLLASKFAGISSEVQAVIVVAAACPTAVASFAMAEAMGADSELAGEIVSSTTLGAMLSLSMWIALMSMS